MGNKLTPHGKISDETLWLTLRHATDPWAPVVVAQIIHTYIRTAWIYTQTCPLKEDITAMTLLPDGTHIATCSSYSESVSIWKIIPWSRVQIFEHGSPTLGYEIPTLLTFLPQSETLISLSCPLHFNLEGQVVQPVVSMIHVEHLHFTDGNISVSHDNHTFRVEQDIRVIKPIPSQKYLFCCNWHQISLLDPVAKCGELLIEDSDIQDADMLSNGKVISAHGDKVKLWSQSKNENRLYYCELTLPFPSSQLLISPTSQAVALLCSHAIILLNPNLSLKATLVTNKTKNQVCRSSLFQKKLVSTKTSHSFDRFLFIKKCKSYKIEIWDIETGLCVQTLTQHRSVPNILAISNGGLLAISSLEKIDIYTKRN